MNTRFFHLAAAMAAALLVAPTAWAQTELRVTNSNWLFAPYNGPGTGASGGGAGAATPYGPPGRSTNLPVTVGGTILSAATTNSNFQGMGATGGNTCVRPLTSPITYDFTTAYPSNATAATAATAVLMRATVGAAFAAGVPRYSLGDVITVPQVDANGNSFAGSTDADKILAAKAYWRVKPVVPGESLLTSAVASTPLPLIPVLVSASSTTSNTVTVSSVPAGVAVGTSLLGQPITAIIGTTTITLAGNANQAIAASTSVDATPAVAYYYSPHAEKVYASQPGRVQITWVTLAPTNGIFSTLTETFSVASSSTLPVRRIYWTEGSFTGPKVSITDNRIQSVSPIYNSNVPKAVPSEVVIPGIAALNNLTTLSYDKLLGNGQLHAFNVEGRILVEYLGNLRVDPNVFTSYGIDVVELVRTPSISPATVYLGNEIKPHDNSTNLTASPVSKTSGTAVVYYGKQAQADGTFKYYAERSTGEPNSPDNFSPASPDAYNSVVFYWNETGSNGIQWPKFQDNYWLRWSPKLSDYVFNTVDAGGSTAANGLQFTDGLLPDLVYQDDPLGQQAQIDMNSQRFYVNFVATPAIPAAGQRNRTLLKFNGIHDNWYVNVYTQAETRMSTLSSAGNGTTTVTVASTAGLEVGMTVSGADGSLVGKIASIASNTQYQLSSGTMAAGSSNLTYTVEEDLGARIFNSAAMVGTRINPPTGHEIGGLISSGTDYYPSAYVNPSVSGMTAANLGAIIPVNAIPNSNTLTVRWFKKLSAKSADFKDQYLPGKVGTYVVSYPAAPSQIVIAQGVGTGDLPPAEASGSVYVQNDSSQPGYNPNEEHAFMLGGRAYALREDLNIYKNLIGSQPASGYQDPNYTSEPYVLVAYTDPSDKRPQIHPYQVLRSNSAYNFNYTATAGTLLVKPYPLPLLPLAMVNNTAPYSPLMVNKDLEILKAVDAPTNTSFTSDDAYKSFTFKDRKGYTWVHRGPHGDPKQVFSTSTSTGTTTVTVASTANLKAGMTVTGSSITGNATIVSITDGTHLVLSQIVTASAQLNYSPALIMKLYYLSQDGFYIPGATSQPAVGTVLPFLRDSSRSGVNLNVKQIDAFATSSQGTDQVDAPLAISYSPAWPSNVPKLRVAETLTLPKYGLPQVRGQKSAQVFYQQSLAQDATNLLTKTSVTLHDPTRQKSVALDASAVGLTQLPLALRTSSYQGKTYFQGLPPSLQQRLYYNPTPTPVVVNGTTIGKYGNLIFVGQFHDEIVGDDYLDLNLLTATEVNLAKGLMAVGSADKSKWDAAIDALSTQVQTFKPDPAKIGSYTVDTSKNVTVNDTSLAVISSPETAQDSYAITATGQGTGYVTMVFGNAGNTDRQPQDDPVQVQVFQIASQLYAGDLKVVTSSNPLDEQVTLRHSGDFAGKPEDYEFDWRWTTGLPSAPATYSVGMTSRLASGWSVVSDPAGILPTAQQYGLLSSSTTLGSSVSSNINPRVYLKDAQGVRINSFDLKPTSLGSPTTHVFVPTTDQMTVGMIVTGDGLAATTQIYRIYSQTEIELTNAPSSLAVLTFTAASDVVDTIRLTPTVSTLVSATGVMSATFDYVSPVLLQVGMRVTWPLLTGTAKITGIVGNVMTIQTPLGTPNPISGTTMQFLALSYTDADIAAGYPGWVAKSTTGVDFTPATAPLGVPSSIVFSADLGNYDGFVLYVNGTAALAYKAPSPQFTSTSESAGLTMQGLSKQFSVDPAFFSTIVNTVEVAVYTSADPNTLSAINFKLEAALETDLVTSGNTWQKPGDFAQEGSDSNVGIDTINRNSAIIGGATSNVFGGPQFVLNDRWFTMRYRPKASAKNVLGTPWSRWTAPQFTEGWLKRVLAAINPFEQRIKDLYNNAVNTDVSMLTQAGTRWEGNLALNMDNINDNGLIAIYETVLNRAKSMSIDANTNDPDTNQQLLLAAGYLNDLYTILGNEAYADAADPTVALDSGAVATSRFCFEGQVASSLDEEMALLRGRDDSASPGVETAPFYNRLVWNYTHGINSGEAIYASNYNIKEKVGSSTANGVIDESDAQRMFPQGHGDAYGHYLTALTGYYRLLWNSNFTWTPSAEAVTVLGVPVTVDFQDERKFAAAAAHLASTEEQVCALTYRRDYQDDPAVGWSQFRDQAPTNTSTGVKRAWGLDEEVSRGAQGALYNWTVANGLLPDVDNYHSGVQKIDRTTVPELALLPAAADSLQATLDNANARLNPLGLSPGSIAFDVDPKSSASHFGQLYGRALTSLNNAAGAFNQAATMSKSLRQETNQVDDYVAGITEQEVAYNNQLIDIYGAPYSGDIGAGKLYSQGYAGEDMDHWFIVDRPSDLVDNSQAITVTIEEPSESNYYTRNSIFSTGVLSTNALIKEATSNLAKTFAGSSGWISLAGNTLSLAATLSAADAKIQTNSKTVTINPSQFVQYSDVWQAGGLGSRSQAGELQRALQATQQTFLAIKQQNEQLRRTLSEMKRKETQYASMVYDHSKRAIEVKFAQAEIQRLSDIEASVKKQEEISSDAAATVVEESDAIAESMPTVTGPLAVDVTSVARGATKQAGAVVAIQNMLKKILYKVLGDVAKKSKSASIDLVTNDYAQAGWRGEEQQLSYEFNTLYMDVTTQHATLMELMINHQEAVQNAVNTIAKGNRIRAEREVFRQRAAAIIQGYRTQDMTFRTFRNEALESYRSLFDLASRYTYLAAKAYDYETGLLGTTQGHTVFDRIVASRALGDLTGGLPQSTTSTLGDAGLAGTMAQLNAEYSVAQGRLGINNPDYSGTAFSLRGELCRQMNDPSITSDDDAWKQTLEQHVVSNVLNDSDVASQCLNIKKSDGSAVPGIIIPFSTTIQKDQNFFGLPLAAFDHYYATSSYATKISNVGIALPGYVGMDAAIGGTTVTSANKANALSATPYVYLIPCGNDCMRAPPLGDTDTIRSWTVQDQALPLPYNLGANDFNSTQFFSANGTLSSQPWIIRKHQAFRAVGDANMFQGSLPPVQYTSSRLVARSVWNTQWKLVIPAFFLSSQESDGINRFVSSVTDIQLYLRTYSHAGN